MPRRWFLAAISALSLLAAGCGPTGGSGTQDKVVYHCGDGFEQTSNGLRNSNP